jgi:transposase
VRFIGLDVHRDWCDVAIYEDGNVRSCGRIATAPDQLQLFAQSLGPDDRVGLETTGNALSIARIIEPHVAGVLVADTRNVRAMTHAKVKNDRVDARMIAKLLAAGMLPGVWICDEAMALPRVAPGDAARCSDSSKAKRCQASRHRCRRWRFLLGARSDPAET